MVIIMPNVWDVISIILSVIALVISSGAFQVYVKLSSTEIVLDEIERLLNSEDSDKKLQLSVNNFASRDFLWKIRSGYIKGNRYSYMIPKQYFTLKANSVNEISVIIRLTDKYEKYKSKKITCRIRYGIMSKKIRIIEKKGDMSNG